MLPETVLVVWNAKRVWVGGPAPHPPTEFQAPPPPSSPEAILVVGNRIKAVGTQTEVSEQISLLCEGAASADAIVAILNAAPGGRSTAVFGSVVATVLHDANQQWMVSPGFVDSHVHLLDGGKRLFSVSLRTCRSKADFVETIRAFIQKERVAPGDWITGGDWCDIALGSFPDKSWVDEATRDHFVLLARLDSHCVVVSSTVLDACAALADPTLEIPGGTIVRDDNGAPTGLIKERAVGYVKRQLWPRNDSVERMAKALEASGKYLASHGITSVHSMSSLDYGNIGEIEFLIDTIKHTGKLPVRVRNAIRVEELEDLQQLMSRTPTAELNDFLSLGAVKFFSDGSLGSRTAAMKKPYTGTCQCGYFLQPVSDLHEGILKSTAAGMQCAVHAIGDAAVAAAVDGIVAAIAKTPGAESLRHRIEHCQHVDDVETLFPLMAKHGIVASCQPSHLLFEGDYVEEVLGADRKNLSYMFNSMLKYDVPLAFGSDWMVAPASVLEGLRAALFRIPDALRPETKGVWNANECLTMEVALRAFTYGGAHVGHSEMRIGSIAPGMLADLVVVSRDLLQAGGGEAQTLAESSVLYTVLDGSIVFEGIPQAK